MIGGLNEEPQSLQPKLFPILPSFDDEAFLRSELEHSRRRIAFFESDIEFFTNLARQHPELLAPNIMEQWRHDLEKYKKWGRELERWDKKRRTKPGVETDSEAIERLKKLRGELWPRQSDTIAPPPHEVKK